MMQVAETMTIPTYYVGGVCNSSCIQIENGASIGHSVILDRRGGLYIGNNVNFSTGVWIWTAEHDINSPDFIIRKESVRIEDFAWCSARVIVLPGVIIREGAVVTKNVEPYAIVGGVPAKKIGERSRDLHYELIEHMPSI